MSRQTDEQRYEGLSPFELKNKLISMASSPNERLMLNAGRGNPNWVAIAPRQAFLTLGQFAMTETERTLIRDGFGGPPEKAGAGDRLDAFLSKAGSDQGAAALHTCIAHARETLGLEYDELVYEFVDGMLGDHYPTPDRMLVNCERIVSAYLAREMCGGSWPSGSFDLFATEGGTAAMAYVFASLMENKLLHKGDSIAIGTPVFTPYLEIPELNDFNFVEVDICQDESAGWDYPASEIEKLADPQIKAFFIVHPSNPTSRALRPETLNALKDLVTTKRQDLIILTDDVYGTFVNDFRSVASVLPHNTILVYSFSKYFGATGWRLGVIGLHEDNALDRAIANLPEQDRSALRERYHEVFLDPESTKLIDRMVADSRTVALHHTAGLSTPQQVFMALLSLSSLADSGGTYKAAAQSIVRDRSRLLYDAIGLTPPDEPNDAHYYTTIDIPRLAKQRYDVAFANHLAHDFEPIDFVWRLASEKSVVLMDGGGFDAPRMSVRVSLANLDDAAYTTIGRAISDLLDEYHAQWSAGT